MARKPRLWYPGATYHLMERGIRRQAIYSDYTDYQTFLAILKRSLKKYSCTLHAFCLMTNHFHLLLETSDTPVGSFMKHLACTYATYYNRKYSYLGHLFEGRYCSGLVKDDSLAEASLVHGIELLGFEHLTDVLRFLEGRSQFTAVPSPSLALSSTPEVTLDFSDVRGQQELIEAITLAAAGGHNLLMIGEPGCGKTKI